MISSKTMKAVVLTSPTAADEIILTDIPVPKVRPGWVLVKVRAFGLNHSEQILRLKEISAKYIQKPIIPGIECVGEIADSSDSQFRCGQKVVALMGGMGRSFNGSYAEYALLPTSHVFAVTSQLPGEQLAAVPETYYTAWGSLFECLNLTSGDTLLICGGTCALGYASLQLAKALGCKVIATTHKKEKLPLLSAADHAVLGTGELSNGISGITKALELVGPKTLYDTLHCVNKGGIVCSTGILGGVFSVRDFDPIRYIPNGVYLTGFYSNSPSQDIIDKIFNFLSVHDLIPCIGGIFKFEDIKEACKAFDKGTINGKIVIKTE